MRRTRSISAMGLLALTSAVLGLAAVPPEGRPVHPRPASLIAAQDAETPKVGPRLMPPVMHLLEGGRSPDQVRALLDGDHDSVMGALSQRAPAFIVDCVELLDLDRPADPDSIDVQHYDIEIHEVDESLETVRATTTVTVQALRTLTSLDLHLADLQVTGVEIDNSGQFEPIGYVHQDSILHVGDFPPLDPGENTRIRVQYEGTEPSCTSIKGIPSGVAFTNVGVHTFGEPTYSRHWFPCHDVPWDKATAMLSVVAPAGRVAEASGILIDTTTENGFEKKTWSIPEPISTYLIAFYLGDYVELTDTAPGDVALEYFVFPDLVDNALEDFEYLPNMVEFFSDVWVPYPNPRYAMTLGWFPGGMEHQMNSLIGLFFIRGNKELESLFSHELAHQWWGDLVTMGSWREIWLNEGFATYSEWIFDEHQYGWPRMLARKALVDSIYIARPDSLDHPLLDPPTSNIFSFVVYQKGGRVLDMLRGVSRLRLMGGPPREPEEFTAAALAGDERFFNMFTRYATEHALGNATSEDFQRAAEAELGENLDWFFDPWLRGKAYPQLVYDYDVIPASNSSGVFLNVQIFQTQAGTQYEMPLHVRYRSGTTILDEVRELRGPSQDWVVSLPPGDWEVILDPDNWLLEDTIPFDISPTLSKVGVFPNPSSIGFTFTANLTTTAGSLVLTIYDGQGRKLRHQDMGVANPGPVALRWDGYADNGRRASAGVYFAHLRVGTQTSTHRLVVLP